MKQPTAPIYPDLPSEDGQNYRLQKKSEIEKQLIKERDVRKALYKKSRRCYLWRLLRLSVGAWVPV